MTTKLIIIVALVSLSLAFLAACNGSGPDATIKGNIVSSTKSSDGTFDMLAIRPAYSTIHGLGNSSSLALRTWLSDGTVEDVLGESWTADDDSIATVDADGRVTAVSAGETLIHGHYHGDDALARVIVDPNPAPGAPQPPNPPPGDPGTGTPPAGTGPQESPPPSAQAPFADRVASYVIGDGGGFNENKLPDVVLGPPKGLGRYLGSYDVFSLGDGGEIILEFTDYPAFDGAGEDFIVFENAFQVGIDPNTTFAEPGVVSVSDDGVTYVDFPCNLLSAPYVGCAGVHPSLANPDTNTIDPTDPNVAGGDAFDLADVGLKKVRFIKIQDSGLGLGPIGPGTRGFDLDAISIIHGTLP